MNILTIMRLAEPTVIDPLGLVTTMLSSIDPLVFVSIVAAVLTVMMAPQFSIIALNKGYQYVVKGLSKLRG